jgi:hypothetical protein
MYYIGIRITALGSMIVHQAMTGMPCHHTCHMDHSFILLAQLVVKFGSIDSHSPMRGHVGHPEASQGDLENQPVL